MALDKSVVTKKRNHIYRGRPYSKKAIASLGEVQVDIGSMSTHLNNERTDMSDTAELYLAHGDQLGLTDSQMAEQEHRYEKIKEIEATTDSVYTDIVPRNGRFQSWSAATLTPPSNWIFVETGGASINRSSDSYTGDYSVEISHVNLNAQYIYQDIQGAYVGRDIEWWKGKTITLSVRAKIGTADKIVCAIDDGATETTGSEWTDSTWALNTMTHTVDSSATYIRLKIGSSATCSTGTNYYDSAAIIVA